MLGVQSGIAGLRSANIINQSTKNINRSINRVMSGSRINSAADDPSGLGVSEQLRNRAAGLDQASQNIQNGAAFLNIADGALSNTANILNRLKELAVKSSDPTLSSAQSNLIKTEFNALTTQIDVNGAVKYGDVSIFAGSTFSFKIGADVNTDMSVKIDKLTTSALGLSGISLGTSAATSKINSALSTLADIQAQVGTYQSTFSYIQDAIDTEATNVREADATLRDTDFAKEMTNYVTETIRMQAAQFMTAQSNQSAYSVLNLLQ